MAENSTRLCPACGRGLEAGTAPGACLRCQTLYHQECWDGLKHCLAFGCAGSPAEAVADLEHQPPARECGACKKENPADAIVCLSCGAHLVEDPPRPVFTSSAGWQAETPEALMEQLDRHWETGVQHLYHGHLEAWLAERGRQDLADAARSVRTDHSQHSVGLEAFLQATGMVQPPLLEISPESLDLEGPGPSVSSSLEIRNSGRGYLSGRLSSQAPWLEFEPHEFAGNRMRVMVVARVSELSGGAAVDTALRLETPSHNRDIPVKARRIGLEDAVALFRKGETVPARALCRKLMESHAGSADASILLAAAYLEEDNPSSAVQALRNMAGACQAVPSDIVEKVFRFLEEGEQGVERLEVYERLVPCAEGPLGVEIRRALGALAMERARAAATAVKGGGGTSLWQGRTATTDDVVELLQMAAAYDSSLASEATTLQKQLQGRLTRSWVAARFLGLLLLAALVAAGFGTWAWNQAQMSKLYEAGKSAYDGGNFAEAAKHLAELDQTGTTYRDSRTILALAYAQWARQEEEKGQVELSRDHYQKAFQTTDPAVREALAGLLTDWAQADEQAGRAGEARVRLEQALQVAPGNEKATAARARIQAATDLYWKVHRLADSPLGQQPLESYQTLGAVAEQVKELVPLGLQPYESRMMVTFADVSGTGDKELIVAGTVGGAGSDAVGHYAVYEMKDGLLHRLEEGSVRPTPILQGMQSADLTGDGKADLLLQWLSPTPEGPGSTLVMGYSAAGKLVREEAPTKLPVDLGDKNSDGRSEIWLAELVAESTGVGDRVVIYHPYLWNAPGFAKATGNFADYYKSYKSSLEQQILNNPYPPGDPRFELYRKDRLKAIGLAEPLIQGAP